MSFLLGIGTWVKSHIVASVVIGTVVVGGAVATPTVIIPTIQGKDTFINRAVENVREGGITNIFNNQDEGPSVDELSERSRKECEAKGGIYLEFRSEGIGEDLDVVYVCGSPGSIVEHSSLPGGEACIGEDGKLTSVDKCEEKCTETEEAKKQYQDLLNKGYKLENVETSPGKYEQMFCKEIKEYDSDGVEWKSRDCTASPYSCR